MKVSLRNRHRMVWMLMVFIVPVFLAFAMQLGLSGSGNRTESPNKEDCLFQPVATMETELAHYKIDNGTCAYAIHAILSNSLRRPELALVVSDSQIELNKSRGVRVEYFEGSLDAKVELASPVLGQIHVAVADLLNNQIIEQVKLEVR